MSSQPLFTLNRRRVVAGAFVLTSVACIVITFLLPSYYASTARITVETDAAPTIAAGPTFAPGLAVMAPEFLQTEFELLRSKELLYPVIEKLGLGKRWAPLNHANQPLTPQETLLLLQRRLDLRLAPNTSLIEIRVLSEDRLEAAQIANTIAELYRDLRLDQLKLASYRGIDTLRTELSAQQRVVTEAQRTVDQLRADAPWTGALGDDSQTRQAAAELLLRLKHQVLDAEIASQQMVSLVKRLNAMKPAELREALPTIVPDELLTELLTRRAGLERELVAGQKELGTNYPSVARVQQVLGKVNDQVENKIHGMLAGLQFKADSLERELALRRVSFEETMKADAENGKKASAYQMAKRDLDSKLQTYQSLRLRLEQEQIDVNLPKGPNVRIVDRAEPGLRPVRPNYALNIFVAPFIGLLVSAVLAAVFFLKNLVTRPPLAAA